MQDISLLSKIFFLLLFPFYLLGFENLYKFKIDDFEITTTKNSYKLVLKSQRYLDYKQLKGFKFFVPYFTTELSLKMLRFNSTGYINGVLSMDKSFKNILDVSPSDFDYYFTDYKKSSKQLSYLLDKKTIPYNEVTSLSIEMYNIPPKVYKKLNRYIYFKKIPLKKNSLKNVLYSFYFKLDKPLLDKYIKTNYPNSKNYIKTFFDNVYKIDLKKSKVTQKKHKKVKKPKLSYKLHLHRFLYMYDYGLVDEVEQNNKITPLLQKLKTNLYKDFNKSVIFQPNLIIKPYLNELQNIINTTTQNSCKFDFKNIDKKCFNNKNYFKKYVYYSIKNHTPPKDNILIGYGDGEIFNDIGKYFFENGYIKKSEVYLQKAFVLLDNKNIINHNLGVLYATHSELYDLPKGINYLKKSNFQVDYYNLGVFYYIGLGVKENDILARSYFKKAPKIPYAVENYSIMKKYKIGLK